MASCGAFHTLAWTEVGELFVLGPGLHFLHQLEDPAISPQAFDGARVLQAAGGSGIDCTFSAVVTEDGGLFCFGESGPWLGLGDAAPESQAASRTPIRVPSESFNGHKVTMTSCGAMHQCAITDSGDVYCWGSGGPRLGLGDQETRTSPSVLPRNLFADCKVVLVACGGVHTAAVTRLGALFTWGFGGEGRLGHGDTTMRNTPTRVRGIGQRFGSGPLRARVMTVSGGGYHTAAITEDGQLWTWGQGRDGALGHADRECRLVPTTVAAPEGCSSGWAVHVACGHCHTGAVSESGDVYSWGKGDKGCLGHADNKDRLQPTRIERLHDGGVKAVHSASGHSHMVVTDWSGRVFTWGYRERPEEEAGALARSPFFSAINSALFRHAKIARICPLPTTLALAFASLTHHRLGKDAVYAGLLPELVERIFMCAWPAAYPVAMGREHEGIARIIGSIAGGA